MREKIYVRLKANPVEQYMIMLQGEEYKIC